MKLKHMNALLVEIMMAVLFFALSAAVILEIFGAGHGLSAQADIMGRAVNHAQQLSEQLYAADDMAAALKRNGFGYIENSWDLDCGDYALRVDLSSDEPGAGMMRSAQITARARGEEMFSLPCACYVAGEVAQ